MSTHRAYLLVNADGSFCFAGIVKNAWAEAKGFAKFGGTARSNFRLGMQTAWNTARQQRDSVLHELGRAAVSIVPAASIPAGEYADSFEQWARDVRGRAAVARALAA